MPDSNIVAISREIRNPRELRRQGRVPAVVYGHGANMELELEAVDLEKMISSGAGRGLIDLGIPGDKAPAKVMIKEIQRHPVRGNVIHVDFYRVSMTERITTSIPLRVRGEEQAVSEGAVVQNQLRQVEVQCLPGEIPESIEVNLLGKTVGDSVTAGDLEAPLGVVIVTDPSAVVVSLVIPRAIEEDLPEEDEDLLVDGEESDEERTDEEAREEG